MSTNTELQTVNRSVLSAANVLETPKIIKEDDENEITINLSENIYTFLLLLYSRQNEDNDSLYSSINKMKLFKIKLFTAISYIVQMSGIIYFLQNIEFDKIDNDTFYIYECDIPEQDYEGDYNQIAFNHINDTIIDNQQCSFFKDKIVHKQQGEPQNIAAKFIASFLLIAFLSSEFLSIPRLITLSKIANRSLKFAWILLTLSQLALIATVLVRILILIYNQDDVVDIFTVGISFIILTEVDDKMYLSVKGLNVFGDQLFCIKINSGKLKEKYDTLYNYISIEAHDCIVLCGYLMAVFISTFFWCINILPLSVAFKTNLGIIVTSIDAFILLIVPGIVLPLFPSCIGKCVSKK